MVADSVNVYDREQLFTDCTIQILSNSITGQSSLGWKINEELRPGRWHSMDEEPPRENCYIVLWKPLEKKYQSRGKLFYEMVWYDEEGVWHVDEDIPQAEPLGGCEILFWMPLPEKPEVM